MSKLVRYAVGAALSSFGMLGGAAGCHAYVEREPAVGYTEITSAPADLTIYPSVIYQGRPVYFYGNRWWYREGPRWSSYADEPAELYRQRRYVHREPAVHERGEFRGDERHERGDEHRR